MPASETGVVEDAAIEEEEQIEDQSLEHVFEDEHDED
jgi:hypothetical protein